MFSPTTFSDIYLQLSFLLFRSLILFMNSAEPILPVYNTTHSDGKNALPSSSVVDWVSINLRESSCNQSDLIEQSHSKTKLASVSTTVESLLGSIRPTPLNSQRKVSIRTHTSFEENANILDSQGGLEASRKDLCQAYTSCSLGSVYPGRQSLQWPSIPHEAVRVPVIMPVKKPVQEKDVSLTGTDPYQCHLPTKPAPIIPRRITCTQPEFVIPLSFNTVTNAPLLLPIAVDSDRIYLQDHPSSSTVNTLYDDRHSLLPVPVTTHTRQPWTPSLGHWINTRLSAVLTCTPLSVLSNSDSMEEFLARFSNPEGLHKPWHQILDDLEYDLDPFRAV